MKNGKKSIATTGANLSGTDVSESTKAGYSAAISFFTDFAKEAGFSSVLEFPEEQINEGFFARICDHIYNFQKDYTIKTLLQYLSGLFQAISSQYPSLSLWVLDDPPSSSPRWYNKLRGRLSGNLKRRVIENGEKLQPNKSSGCGRQLLKEIAKAMLKTNKVDSIESRTESVCAWLSCGRCSLLSSIPHISLEPQRRRWLHST
jgi:hypothetical protein